MARALMITSHINVFGRARLTIGIITRNTTYLLEGESGRGPHTSIWQALTCMQMVLQDLETEKMAFPVLSYRAITHSVNLVWDEIEEHYQPTDSRPACGFITSLSIDRDPAS